MRNKFPTDRPAVVTCGLPYANGDLHIGHLRTYISGDVMVRALRKLGQKTAFVCGSDMHGTPIAVNAAEEGVEPEEFAMEFHKQYEETFPEFNIDFDNYGHTHDETNFELTREFVRNWIDNGHVFEKEIKVAWDEEEDQPLPDRYVVGTCPYCGEEARGDECDEGCQRHLEPGEIENPVSKLTGNPAEYREREHKFLRLSDFEDELSEFLDQLEGTQNAKNQPREWIKDGLKDLCITRDMDWGIDYPGESKEDLVLYVWVDAPIEYVSSTKQYSERAGKENFDWEEVWKEDGDIIHIIGRDIIQHHTIFWPSMLLGAEYSLPRAIAASGFVNLNGEAFSTSRNRAIWAKDYLEEDFHPGLLRYYITSTGEFQDDIDFSWGKFQDKVNGEIVGNLGNFIYRSLVLAARNWGGAPDKTVSEEVENRIQESLDQFRDAVNNYSVREIARSGIDLSSFGNEYLQRNEPWNKIDDSREEAAQTVYDCIQISKALAILLYPVFPVKMASLWDALNENDSLDEVELSSALERPADDFESPDQFFKEIEDERVEELNTQLEEKIE